MESLDKAIEIAGGLSKLAKELGVSSQRVSNWRSRGVPEKFSPKIERVTKGQVLCEDLCPDVDWTYLRSSSCAVVR